MAKRSESDLKPLGKIISESLDAGYLGLAREIVKVFEVWGKAVGEYNAKRTRPESIQNGRLTVVVESSVWIDHLSYFKAEFINNINKALGSPMVDEIVFRAGVVADPDRTDTAGGGKQRDVQPKKSKSVSPRVKEALNTVHDEELQGMLVKLLARQNDDPK